MAAKTSASKMSKGKVSKDSPRGNGRAGGRPARAHRDDTPEAAAQRRGTPKTHPTRAASSARKDKPGRTAAGRSATRSGNPGSAPGQRQRPQQAAGRERSTARPRG